MVSGAAGARLPRWGCGAAGGRGLRLCRAGEGPAAPPERGGRCGVGGAGAPSATAPSAKQGQGHAAAGRAGRGGEAPGWQAPGRDAEPPAARPGPAVGPAGPLSVCFSPAEPERFTLPLGRRKSVPLPFGAEQPRPCARAPDGCSFSPVVVPRSPWKAPYRGALAWPYSCRALPYLKNTNELFTCISYPCLGRGGRAGYGSYCRELRGVAYAPLLAALGCEPPKSQRRSAPGLCC